MTEDARTRIDDLFRRYAAGVSRYLLLRVGSAELAEELTARVFLAVVRNFEQLRGSPIGWLWAIVRTELSRHYREPALRHYSAEIVDGRAIPEEVAERREEDRHLIDALQDLSEDDQQLISLKFFLGLSNVEIAVVLQLTPSNVGVKLHRTLKELRKRLEPQYL